LLIFRAANCESNHGSFSRTNPQPASPKSVWIICSESQGHKSGRQFRRLLLQACALSTTCSGTNGGARPGAAANDESLAA